MKNTQLILLTFSVFLFVALPVSAGDFDGSRPVICAIIELHECILGDDCEPVMPEEVDLPRFITIDFKKKKIQGVTADGGTRSTKIERLERDSGTLIIQGGEGGKGWTISIVEETGKAVMAIAIDDVAVMGFGACMIR